MRQDEGVLDGRTVGRLDRWRRARAFFIRPDGIEAERAVARVLGRAWSRAQIYGRARRLLVDQSPGLSLSQLESRIGPLAANVRVAPEDPLQTKWDAMGSLVPLPRARREVEALWLLEVLRSGELFAEFQPIFELTTGKTLGFEGLLRARARDGFEHRAAEIFPAAAALRIETAFERVSWACLLEAAQKLPGGAQLFLNMNPQLLPDSGGGLASLGEEVERAAFPYTRLVLDVVEIEKVESTDGLRAALMVPRDLGVAVALDDVTSGYGTLRYCGDLLPEWIKVDCDITRGIANDPRRREILKFLSGLTHDFPFGLIAEGVETGEDLDVCAAEGVRACQGYFLARPSVEPPGPSPDFKDWLASRPRQVSSSPSLSA